MSSNNTNKLSPQEHRVLECIPHVCSNNTNKLSPQEQRKENKKNDRSSNNTNKLSPQELGCNPNSHTSVQIIQINLVLKNYLSYFITSYLFK